MLSKNLELTLHRALMLAHRYSHEYATLEHLLLSMTEDADVQSVFVQYGIDTNSLITQLKQFLDKELAALKVENISEVKPTAAFQKVVHRAAVNAHAIDQHMVTSANVLAEIFGEHDSHAAYFLRKQDITYLDVINYVNHRDLISFSHEIRGNLQVNPQNSADGILHNGIGSENRPDIAQNDIIFRPADKTKKGSKLK